MADTATAKPLDRDEAIRILRGHEAALRARGVTRLALFGSVVRGTAGHASDVDVLVDIDRARKFSLIDRSELRLFLADLLGREVDLAKRDGLKPFLGDAILTEAVEVFCFDEGIRA